MHARENGRTKEKYHTGLEKMFFPGSITVVSDSTHNKFLYQMKVHQKCVSVENSVYKVIQTKSDSKQ